MNAKVAKRIRRSNRELFPIGITNPDKHQLEDYRRDIRKLSKENKNLISNGSLRLSPVKDRTSRRQRRIGGTYGYHASARIIWAPVGKKFKSGGRFKAIFPKPSVI